MLLSVFVSFILARRFRWKTYVLFSAVIVALVSFLSAGVPHYETYPYPYPELLGPESTSGVVVYQLLPLSFPFYAIIYRTSYLNPFPPREGPVWEFYQVNLLTFQFFPYQELMDVTATEDGQPTKVLYMDWVGYGHYYLLFFLLNLVGAVIGYLISRTAYVDQRLRRRKSLATLPYG